MVFFNNQPFPWVSEGFLERRIPGKNGEGTLEPFVSAFGRSLHAFRAALKPWERLRVGIYRGIIVQGPQ